MFCNDNGNTMSDYMTPYAATMDNNGCIVPHEGWWAFDVDLSLYRPEPLNGDNSIKLQMRSWTTQHVSLWSSMTASIDGDFKQQMKKSGTSSATIAKGVMLGAQAVALGASAIAGFKAASRTNGMGAVSALGSIAGIFGCGGSFAGLFEKGSKPMEATIQTLEQKFEKSRFTRVDSDIIDRLIVKSDAPKSNLSEEESDNLSAVFRTQLPKLDKTEFMVQVDALGAEARPVVITQNEYMRRMKDMSKFQTGMGFYGQMPDSFNLVLNSDHPLVKKVLDDSEAATAEALKPILSELKGQEARLAAIRQAQDKKKYDEITQEEKDQKAEAEKAVQAEKDKKTAVIADYAKGNSIVHQLIDLALLQNGMLKGEALDRFLKRSVDLIK